MGQIWGHVGIYIGDNKVAHNSTVGQKIHSSAENRSPRIMSLDDWINTYDGAEKPKWGWFGGYVLE